MCNFYNFIYVYKDLAKKLTIGKNITFFLNFVGGIYLNTLSDYYDLCHEIKVAENVGNQENFFNGIWVSI